VLILNVLIIFFSQTGGTEKIAKKIRQGIVKAGNTCEIIKMKGANSNDLSKYDLIGIGAPTFFFREPVNVRTFIQNMYHVDGRQAFLFCTHGSIIGNTFYHMSDELTKKGYVVIGSFDSYSASSLQFYPKIMHTINHPDDIEIKEAIDFGENICDISVRIEKGDVSLIPKFELIEDTWWARDSKMLTLDLLRQIYPKFKIDVDKCTLCLTCQENCPTDAINVESEPPEIQNEGCIYCCYCEKSCPESAIGADWEKMRTGSRGNLKKYVRALKEAENQGKFRPYVDYENIV
jgi:flavodoxin/NAD-dependent dihydropyrimidine dehydrogenase PreA subunit